MHKHLKIPTTLRQQTLYLLTKIFLAVICSEKHRYRPISYYFCHFPKVSDIFVYYLRNY